MPISPVPIAIAVVEHEGKLLIGRRPEGKPLAGLWEFPGGKVEAGESPAAAAERECLEETGVRVRVGAAYPEVVQQYDHDRVRLFFFACTLADPAAVSAIAAGYRWVAPSELGAYEFPAANAGLLTLLAGNAEARRSPAHGLPQPAQ
ncbi:MAG: (deoxy)nucleoside triphosphate pyrophosphohydrolase [Planctomycetia bacterium]|nr:(deoxy)nucleoside triphosphate pyrophosphohydrolase [Planctomycetia bacterium]